MARHGPDPCRRSFLPPVRRASLVVRLRRYLDRLSQTAGGDRRAVWSPTLRLVALLVVAVLVLGISGLGGAWSIRGATAAAATSRAAPAPWRWPHCGRGGRRQAACAHHRHGRPRRHHRRRHHRRAARWTPVGTGMWIYVWTRTDHGSARRVVRQSRRAGLSTLYVRTGSSWDGFTGGPELRRLLPAVRHSGISVVAWDFPSLVRPWRDAARLARAAWFGRGRRGWAKVRAVAPDIETPAEGTRLTARRVTGYLRRLRHLLPRSVSILVTVPWPSAARVGRYPYRLVARYADALLPMAYWFTNPAGAVTARSIRFLRRFHRPVLPIGQGFDNRVDDPYLPRSHPWRELAAFLRAAHRGGVRAVSLWVWQTAGRAQWLELLRGRRFFPTRVVAR